MNVNDYNIIFVVADIMMGGNHLSNILSTSDLIEDKARHNRWALKYGYQRFLVELYNSMYAEAHIDEIAEQRLELLFDAQHKHQESTFIYKNSGLKKPIISPKHVHSLSPHLRNRPDLKPLILKGVADITPMTQLLINRTEKSTNVDNGVTWESLPPCAIINYDVNLLFGPDINELVTFFNDQLSLGLDVTFCQELHTKWYTSLCRIYKV